MSKTTTPPPRPMTIRDFARRMGVSKTTVSKAFTGNGRIAPATRAAILGAAREVGFDMNPHAQRLSVGRSADLVSLFGPESAFVGSAGQKIFRIQQILAEQGLDVPLYSTGRLDADSEHGQVEGIRRLCRQSPRAIITSTISLPEAAHAPLRAYQAEGGIVICYDVPISLQADAVVFDREDSGYKALRHLLELGHRRIGLYLVGSREAGHAYLLSRLAGARRALGEFGVTEHDGWYREGGAGEDDGAHLAEWFLALSDRPSALYVANETVASTFINTLIRAGLRVPRDVSVVSNDDLPVARHAVVPITTVSARIEQIAQTVRSLLADRLRHPDQPFQRVIVQGDLIRRDSAASPC